MARNSQPELARVLGFWALVVYGVGDILGAGIYAVVGKVAGAAGDFGWAAFLVAMTAAGFTALSYAELASRYPRSGSEAYYSRQAFGNAFLSRLVAWMVLCSAVVSIAAVSHAFSGYLRAWFPGASHDWLITAMVAALAIIAFWGMRQSSSLNIAFTAVEVSGLLIVIVAGGIFLSGEPSPLPAEPVEWTGIFSAATLAFYAFIGFEDLANIAEEVKMPHKILPRAILTSVAIAGTLYVVVVVVATAVSGAPALAQSEAPLAEVVAVAAPQIPLGVFAVIAVFAVSNTALLNFVAASRVLYGVARQGLAPTLLGEVHPQRRTPHWAILIVASAALALSLSGSLTQLAGATSVLILAVFFTVNVSLIALRFRPREVDESFQAPRVTPYLGAVVSPALIYFAPVESLATAAALILFGALLAVSAPSPS